MATEFARGIAAQCWCDPRTSDREMDSDLAEVFAEKLDEYIGALQWCSGSADFQSDGRARKGWKRLVVPLISEEKEATCST